MTLNQDLIDDGCYYSNMNAFIFVKDSSDIEQLDKVKEELFFILEEEELNKPFVIMANKQVEIFLGCKWLFD